MKQVILSSLLLILILGGIGQRVYGQINPEAMRNEAEQEMKFGRYGESIDLLNRYISARPQKADGYNLRGICYEKREQFELSVYDYRSARKLDPSNKEIRKNLERATSTWYKLLYNNIEGYKREIAINPNKAENYLEIGKAYKNLGKWEVAEQWYDQYLAREHASPDEIIRYTEILAKNNHIAKGWPILKKYTDEYPEDQRLWSRYGYFSMWLGKNKIAIKAFENALALKPYFKEAQDGLDQAKGKGYIYTVNDTASRYNYGMPVPAPAYSYPIDKFYHKLKSNPDDTDTRLKLVKALYKANRLEEAYQQVQILSKTPVDSTLAFQELKDQILSYREKYYAQKIEEYKTKLKDNPHDKKAVLMLGTYYANLRDYDKATELYNDYLSFDPGDKEIIYRSAQVAAWNHDFSTAIDKMDELLKMQPNNLKYQMFRGQLAVWTSRDLDLGEKYLTNVEKSDSSNLNLLVSLGSLYLQKQNFDLSQSYINRAKAIDPNEPNLNKLESDYVFQQLRAQQEKLFKILEEGRKLAMDGDCEAALPKYEEYMSKAEPNRLIRKEYADANACAHNYAKAISIYDDLLGNQYDYDIDLQRAKVYYYMGDSTKALSAFQKLAEDNPGEYDVNLYLGDSYTKMHEYSKARSVYDNILENNDDSLRTAVVEQRLSWLPVTGFAGIIDSFPSYVLLTPSATFYGDNLGFRYNTQGLRADLGIAQFLSIGAEGSRGTLASDNLRENFTQFKWNIGFRFTPEITAGIGFGTENFGLANDQKNIADGYFKYDVPKHYGVKVNFSMMDASQILYSPFLVGVRMDAKAVNFGGYYRFKAGFNFSAKYTYIDVSDGNKGGNLELRVGKYFMPNFLFGYEFYNSNFDFNSYLYFSPQNYSSHSLFADWNIIGNEKLQLDAGGKIGLITNSSYILRQGFISATYKVIKSLSVQAYLAAGSSVQDQSGYNSLAFTLAAYWTL